MILTIPPFIQSKHDEINITIHDGTKMKSTQPINNISRSNFLSRLRSIRSNFNNKKESKKISRKLNCCHMTQYCGLLHQLCSINPKLTYPLVTSSLNNKQLKSIHSIILPFFLERKGFNRNWPDGFRYENHQYCGLELLDYRVE